MIVLSGSYAETGKFADQENLRGIFHIVNRDKIRGQNPGVIHILPSFYARRDFHAMNAELERMKRNGAALDVIEWREVGDAFVKADDVDAYREQVEPPVNPKKAPKSDVAISPPAHEVIQDVQASQVAALTAEPAPAGDDDFWAAIGMSEES